VFQDTWRFGGGKPFFSRILSLSPKFSRQPLKNSRTAHLFSGSSDMVLFLL
jgi:hypothetical protein